MRLLRVLPRAKPPEGRLSEAAGQSGAGERAGRGSGSAGGKGKGPAGRGGSETGAISDPEGADGRWRQRQDHSSMGSRLTGVGLSGTCSCMHGWSWHSKAHRHLCVCLWDGSILVYSNLRQSSNAHLIPFHDLLLSLLNVHRV